MKKSVLSWIGNPYVILLLIDLVLSNIWEFWRDKKSTSPLYKNQDGWMDWFYMDLFSTYCRPMLICVAIAMHHIKKIEFGRKHIWFVCIYFIMLVKDAFDFVQNGNKPSMVLDLCVFLVTIIVCEVISEVTTNNDRNVRNPDR